MAKPVPLDLSQVQNFVYVHSVKFQGGYEVSCFYQGNPKYKFIATQTEIDTLTGKK